METETITNKPINSRSPHKQITDADQLPVTMLQMAALMAGANKVGTSKLFTPAQLYNRSNEYFNHCINNPIQSNQLITAGQRGGEVVQIPRPRMFTEQGLCLYLGINTKYFYQLVDQLKDKEDELSIQYSNIIAYIRNTISQQRFELAAVREFDAMFISKLEGLKDSVEHSGEVKNTNTITFDFANIPNNIEDCEGVDVTDLMKRLTTNTL